MSNYLVACDGNCDMCEIRDDCPLPSDMKRDLAEHYFAEYINPAEPEPIPLTAKDVMFEMQGSLFNFIQGWEIVYSSGDKINKKAIAKSMMTLFPFEMDDVSYEIREQFSEIVKVIAEKVLFVVAKKCQEGASCSSCCLKEYCAQRRKMRLSET